MSPEELAQKMGGDTLETTNVEDAAKAKENEQMFTYLVHMLKNFFPNEKIKEVTSFLWEACNKQKILCSVADVPTLGLAVNKSQNIAFIIMPWDFAESVQKNCNYKVGGIVFVASQVRDYLTDHYFDKKIDEKQLGSFFPPSVVMDRCRAYEAEYILTMQSIGEMKLNKYQQDLLEKFPQGLATPRIKELLYFT